MSNIDQQFVEFIVKSLVNSPDAVEIARSIDEKGVLLELTVDPEDLGRVIGKRGATAQSIRTLLRALGTKNEARYNLKIIDNGPQSRSSDDSLSKREESSEAVKAEEPVSEAPKEEAPAPSEPEAVAEPVAEEEPQVSLADKHRKELADLDDLEI